MEARYMRSSRATTTRPQILTHATEYGGGSDGKSERVIGFMVKELTSARPATLKELPKTSLGITHGPLRPKTSS